MNNQETILQLVHIDKALLHTWSLAVEMAVSRSFFLSFCTHLKSLTKQTKYIGILLLILFSCSFCLSVKLTPENPIYAFLNSQHVASEVNLQVDWCTLILTNILYHRLSKKLLNIQVLDF